MQDVAAGRRTATKCRRVALLPKRWMASSGASRLQGNRPSHLRREARESSADRMWRSHDPKPGNREAHHIAKVLAFLLVVAARVAVPRQRNSFPCGGSRTLLGFTNGHELASPVVSSTKFASGCFGCHKLTSFLLCSYYHPACLWINV